MTLSTCKTPKCKNLHKDVIALLGEYIKKLRNSDRASDGIKLNSSEKKISVGMANVIKSTKDSKKVYENGKKTRDRSHDETSITKAVKFEANKPWEVRKTVGGAEKRVGRIVKRARGGEKVGGKILRRP